MCISSQYDVLNKNWDNFPCTCEDPRTGEDWRSTGVPAFLNPMDMQIDGKHWSDIDEDKLIRDICPVVSKVLFNLQLIILTHLATYQ